MRVQVFEESESGGAVMRDWERRWRSFLAAAPGNTQAEPEARALRLHPRSEARRDLAGDAANAILSAIGYNFRQILAWPSVLARLLPIAMGASSSADQHSIQLINGRHSKESSSSISQSVI